MYYIFMVNFKAEERRIAQEATEESLREQIADLETEVSARNLTIHDLKAHIDLTIHDLKAHIDLTIRDLKAHFASLQVPRMAAGRRPVSSATAAYMASLDDRTKKTKGDK